MLLPSWDPAGRHSRGTFRCKDFGLSTSQLNTQSWFKQCGGANLLKGLTQHCRPKGNIYGRTADSRRSLAGHYPAPVLVSPCVLQLPPSSLSADLFSRCSACRRWIRSCGYRAAPTASAWCAWCAAPRWLPGREIWNFKGGGGRRSRRVFSGKAKP